MKKKIKLTSALAGAAAALAITAFVPVSFAQVPAAPAAPSTIEQPESAARGSAPNTSENNANVSTSTAPSFMGGSVAGSSGATGANDATAGNTAVNPPNRQTIPSNAPASDNGMNGTGAAPVR